MKALKLSVVCMSAAYNEGRPGWETVIGEPACLCCHALMHSCVRMHLVHKPRRGQEEAKKSAVLLMEMGVLDLARG